MKRGFGHVGQILQSQLHSTVTQNHSPIICEFIVLSAMRSERARCVWKKRTGGEPRNFESRSFENEEVKIECIYLHLLKMADCQGVEKHQKQHFFLLILFGKF